jgi:thiamine pyrophosphokinase
MACCNALIVSGGTVKDYSYIKTQIAAFKPDVIICADSGYNHAEKMNLDVSLVVGDFDSLEEMPGGIKTVCYPAKKNTTDTEIALTHARELGAVRFLLVGATGTRADHTLTNILLLNSCLLCGEDAAIIDEYNTIQLTNTSVEITGAQGSLVSLVPLSDCEGVTTAGLDYPLTNAMLRVGESLGVSNVMSGSKAGVSLRKGTLAVIQARD